MAQPKRDYSQGFRIDGPRAVPDPEPPVDSRIMEFSEPPPKFTNFGQPGQGRRQRFIATLKTRPGEWAEYLPEPGKRGWKSSTTGWKEMEPCLEVTQRSIGNGLFRVWVRYVPEEQ